MYYCTIYIITEADEAFQGTVQAGKHHHNAGVLLLQCGFLEDTASPEAQQHISILHMKLLQIRHH